MVALDRLGQVADFSNQRLEELATRHANYLEDASRIDADIAYVRDRITELRASYDPLWQHCDARTVDRVRCQMSLGSVITEIDRLEVRIRRHRRHLRGKISSPSCRMSLSYYICSYYVRSVFVLIGVVFRRR